MIFQLRDGLIVAASLVILLVSPHARASPIVLSGNSDSSTFSDCLGSGCPSGGFTSITLESTAPGGSDSTLSIQNASFSISDNASGLPLAELTLAIGNKPGATEGLISFDYELNLIFTSPVASRSQVFDLAIQGNAKPGANGAVFISGLTLDAISPIVLPGWTLSDFRFVNSGATGSFSDGIWTVSGNAKKADLLLVADAVDPPLTIPEPTSLALFASALICFGALKLAKFRQTQRKAPPKWG